MPLKTDRRKRYLYLIAGIVATLLLANAALMYRNSRVIEINRQLEVEAEKAKVNSIDIIRNVHLLDMGVRGYALTKQEVFLLAVDSAVAYRNKTINRVEGSLRKQGYQDMHKLYALRDSIDAYFAFADKILKIIQSGDQELGNKLIGEDRGYSIWLHHQAFTRELNQFEDSIQNEAVDRYNSAVRRTYVVQLIIFLLTVPGIFYMAFFAVRTFVLADKLRNAELEKNKILLEQNEMLDRLVAEKTRDIQAQNEEIMAQNEEIRAHNDQLTLQQSEIEDAKQVIEQQAGIIAAKNRELTEEVETQTQDLRQANNELIAYNTRLEQFTYIISHNLRAPLARLKGLANIMEYTKSVDERENIFKMIVSSSYELDTVINDLGYILSIDQSKTLVKTTVNLKDAINKALQSLKNELEEVGAKLAVDVDAVITLNCLAPYVDSILHNLLSNAIKYRSPERPLELRIDCKQDESTVTIVVSDNGLGIDLARYGTDLFSLYKRFHLHVEGKGIGLYLVKTQVAALGGKIDVVSAVDKGTIFSVQFQKK